MSEYEILYLTNLTEDQRFNLLQWWAGVTFAVIAVSHFARKELNLFFVALIVLLYVGFSLFVAPLFFANMDQAARFRQDLQSLQESGAVLSAVSLDIISGGPNLIQATGFYIAGVGAFCGSISYVIYSYVKMRRPR